MYDVGGSGSLGSVDGIVSEIPNESLIPALSIIPPLDCLHAVTFCASMDYFDEKSLVALAVAKLGRSLGVLL